VLWPDSHVAPFIAAVEAAVRANLAFAAQVLREGGSALTAAADARREAGMTSTAAEVSLRRLLLQGRGRTIGGEAAGALLAELRRLTGMATAAYLAESGDLSAKIEQQVARCQDLAKQWRDSLK
jgi:hypothetical protein